MEILVLQILQILVDLQEWGGLASKSHFLDGTILLQARNILLLSKLYWELGYTDKALKMRCFVPFCNSSDNVRTSEISFHGFPSEVHLRNAWLRTLGLQDSHLLDSAVVCSHHFLNDDIYETEGGLRKIVTGAIPSTVQVCMVCLDTDSKLFLMSKHKLEGAYEKLTGHPSCDQGNLKQALCVQCAQRLINFSRFRDKSLRARALMMDLVEKHEFVTGQHIKLINRTDHQLESNMVLTMLGPDNCDLHILEHLSEEKQTELEKTKYRVVVKMEESDDSVTVDEDTEKIFEGDNDGNDFIQDPLKYESDPLQCSLCLEDFVHEHEYMRHMNMHFQYGDGDGVCDTSQVCKPHTAVSSSPSRITENKKLFQNVMGVQLLWFVTVRILRLKIPVIRQRIRTKSLRQNTLYQSPVVVIV
nr:uncharacterized protein LOC117984006 [Maniola hyperantus]